jgi:Effector-associated domain 4/NACHT domain
MPRVSYGPEAKRRAAKLLGLILAFANDGIEGDEGALDLLRSQVQVHWQGDRQLVVRTTVRALVALGKVAEVGLSGEQVKEGLRRLGDFVGVLEDNRSSGSGSETWHFTLRLWFGRWEAAENLAKLEVVWEERRGGPLAPKFGGGEPNLGESNPVQSPPELGDLGGLSGGQDDRWIDYCRNSLVVQNVGRSTSNPLTLRDGIAFDWADLYVPLGIVARDEEEAIEIDPETFLSRLIEQGGRSAIVGEPGTGKTTLLQKLAWGLLGAGKLPVWVSLADLQGQGLEAYLLGEWLRSATGEFVVPEALAGELAARVKAGQVWLILDAVDEMGLEGSLALSHLARQLRGWLGVAPVVLSCRSQVWDSGQNRLEGFSCYRNVDFVAQQDAFVRRWFGASSAQAEGLLAQLGRRSTIRDLVQNPLCLALLCRTWAVNQGVATTRSSLYRQFVEALFDWKQDVMPTDLRQRLRLADGLGTVAIAAIKAGSFRLSQGFLQQVWGRALSDLLPLALQLGWLKTTAAQSGESVYAFLHPTFQEYFAAQGVADWEGMFGSNYLWEIIQPQWREVVGFWLGRSDIATVAKEELLQQLVNFDDRAGGFYRYRAYFLAATGLAEFPESRRARAIAARIVRWRFGWCEGGTWTETHSVVQSGTQAVMGLSDRAIMTAALERYLMQLRGQSLDRKSTFFALWNSAYSLGKQYVPGHGGAIEVLRELLQAAESPYFRVQLSNNLVKINPGDEVAIGILRELMKGADLKIQRRSAHCLAMIDSEDREAIAKLRELATLQDGEVRKMAIASLNQLTGNMPVAQRRFAREKPAALREIEALEKKIKETQNPGALVQAAGRLGKLVPGHGGAIEVLVALLERDGLEESFYRRVGDCLGSLLTEERYGLVVARLYGLRGVRGRVCDRLLWEVTRAVNYKLFLGWVEGDRSR